MTAREVAHPGPQQIDIDLIEPSPYQIRHKIVDMAMRVNATQAYLESLAWRVQQGESPVAEIAMLKNQATQTMAFCASEAVQIHGGMGFMRGTKVERIYREVKVNAIGGGAEEIMKDLAARQMGL